MVEFNAELQIGKGGGSKSEWIVRFESDKERASVSELSEGLIRDIMIAENNLSDIPECIMDRLLVYDKDILYTLGSIEDRTLPIKVYAENNMILSIMPHQHGGIL